MNPDHNINVVAVYPGGLAVFYGHASSEEDGGVRPKLYSRQFANYGQAKLFAQEYEEAQRIERARKSK